MPPEEAPSPNREQLCSRTFLGISKRGSTEVYLLLVTFDRSYMPVCDWHSKCNYCNIERLHRKVYIFCLALRQRFKIL